MDSQKKFLPKLYPLKKEIEKTWYVEYTGKDGRKKKVYGKLNDYHTIPQRLKEADFLIARIIADDLPKSPTSAGNQLLKDLQEIFNLKMEGWSSKTISAFQTHLNVFARWYRENGCPEMNALQALKFLNTISKKNNATTRNNYRRNLKGLFNGLCKYYKNRYTENPFAVVNKVRETLKTKEWFRPEMMEEVIKEIKKDHQVHLSCRIMFHCFGRPNEIRQLKCSDIIVETKKLRIESVIAKTSIIRFVPIPDSLFIELKDYAQLPANWYIFSKDGFPGVIMNGINYLANAHNKILRGMSIDSRYTYYSWKNTGAVKMLMQDRHNLRYISKCMGHHSLDMTDKYFQSLGVDEMGEAIIFPEM